MSVADDLCDDPGRDVVIVRILVWCECVVYGGVAEAWRQRWCGGGGGGHCGCVIWPGFPPLKGDRTRPAAGVGYWCLASP